MPHHAMSNHIMIHVATLMRTLKRNVMSMTCPTALQLAREYAR